MKLDIVDKTEIEVNFNVGDNRIACLLVMGDYNNYFHLINYTNTLRIYER